MQGATVLARLPALLELSCLNFVFRTLLREFVFEFYGLNFVA
jgi:hypothetical protein